MKYQIITQEQLKHAGKSAEKYLDQHIEGGLRHPERNEHLLRKTGLIVSDQWAGPSGSPINVYGNIKSSYVLKMISALQAAYDTEQNSKDSWNVRRFRIAGPSQGRAMKNGEAPQCRKTFLFCDIADAEFKRLYKGNYAAALEYALRTVICVNSMIFNGLLVYYQLIQLLQHIGVESDLIN